MSGAPDYSAPAAPGSLWAATATPAPERPALAGETTADVCVVGAGFTGLSAALHLAAGGAKVCVVEAGEVGWGASGRTGGQVIPGLKRDPDEIEAMLGRDVGGRLIAASGRAPDLVFELIERHGIDCDAARPGWIQPAHDGRALAVIAGRAEQWARYGVEPEMLDRARTAALLGTEVYAGGWRDPRGGHVQPLSYVRGLARAAEAAGAEIFVRSPATGLARDGGRWRVETGQGTGAGTVHAGTVILATNGYTDGLWPGLAQAVIPVYSMQIATTPLSENVRRSILPEGHAASDTFRLLLYFRFDRSGRLIMGGSGPFEERPGLPDAGDLVAAVGRLFPQLGAPEFDYAWGGRVAVTPDHLPRLMELAPGLLAGLGYNGRGVAMGTLMGKCLAELAGGTPAADVPVPMTGPRRIPLHGLRRPAVAALAAWWRLRDRMERG